MLYDQLTEAQRLTIAGIRGRAAAKLLPWQLADDLLAAPDGAVRLRYLARDGYAGSIDVDVAGGQHLGPGWNLAEAGTLAADGTAQAVAGGG